MPQPTADQHLAHALARLKQHREQRPDDHIMLTAPQALALAEHLAATPAPERVLGYAIVNHRPNGITEISTLVDTREDAAAALAAGTSIATALGLPVDKALSRLRFVRVVEED